MVPIEVLSDLGVFLAKKGPIDAKRLFVQLFSAVVVEFALNLIIK